ncbi:MAG: carbohydrate kinase [Candidatus Marinimicrobia bacterium]|nr:carbohydrate kinase [Candidatus Neomarinimicrobiota bacterium]
MKNNLIIAGLGEILWDIFPDNRRPGGAPANFIYHIQQLGYSGKIISAVGQDKLGNEILDWLEKKGLDESYITKSKQYSTGRVEVKLDSGGEPEYNIIENVAWDYLPYSTKIEELAPKVSAVCFGSLAQRNQQSRETIQQFLQHTANDCIKIFDINLRQNFYTKDLIIKNLKITNILKLNTDELTEIAEMFSIQGSEDKQLHQILHKYDLDLIALTKGSHGSRLFSNHESSYLKPLDTKIKDTVGAGDSFTAGLVSGLLRDLPLKQCHTNANLLASYVCSKSGATPTFPPRILSKIS